MPGTLENHDPVLGQFLGFLACDIASHSERRQAILCVAPSIAERRHRMIASGHPPDDWDQLVKEANPAVERLDCNRA